MQEVCRVLGLGLGRSTQQHGPLIRKPPSLNGDEPYGIRIRGTLEGLDPLNKVPFKRLRAIGRVKKGPP